MFRFSHEGDPEGDKKNCGDGLDHENSDIVVGFAGA
jgi:hypothetical protein